MHCGLKQHGSSLNPVLKLFAGCFDCVLADNVCARASGVSSSSVAVCLPDSAAQYTQHLHVHIASYQLSITPAGKWRIPAMLIAIDCVNTRNT